ncbi:MAG: NrfD/PsrC family molybdoenzyme membrane anchor subunit [Candidatus Methylomirabilales bacterium]
MADDPKARKELVDAALEPLSRTSIRFWLFVAALVPILGFWAYNVYVQVTVGHGIHGLGTKGAIWGIIVANIIHLIGISHVGIAISATVRIMNLERYKPLARIAELVTLVSMTAAVMNIALDVGRVERFLVNVVLYGRLHSPFVWSMTVISWYVVGSSVYLYLAMRRDLCIGSNKIPERRWLYRILSVGYVDTPEVRERHNRTVWWCAVIILPIMVSVHSVYGWVFGLQAGRPGWFNPIMAPYFVLGAIVSGFSAMIIIAAIVRRAFPTWKTFLPPRMFKGLGIFLGFVTWLYMYFLFSELLTGQYGPPEADHSVWSDILWGRWRAFTWIVLVGGMFIPFWMLFVQGVNRKICSIRLTVTAAVMINLALWSIRYLIVVPSFYHPHLPYKIAPYRPTFEEWTVLGGTWIFAILFFAILLKLVPVIELPEDVPVKTGHRYVLFPLIAVPRMGRTLLITATAIFGLSMMAYGFSSWQYDYAPVKWLIGIFSLCAIPLEICLVLPREEMERKTIFFPSTSVQRYSQSARTYLVGQPGVGFAQRIQPTP